MEVGFALYESLISRPPPGSGDSSPRQRESSTSTRPCGSGRPSACTASSAAAAFCAWCLAVNGNSSWSVSPPRSKPTRLPPSIRSNDVTFCSPKRWISMSSRPRYGSSSGSSGTTAVPPAGSAPTTSAFARATFSTVPSSSRCTGPMLVITPTSGRAIAHSSAICPEPAHAHLADDELGVGLDASQRQRQADLVVVTALGGDRLRVRPAHRGQDVLRRRLAGRAGDRHDARGAPPPDLAAERAERREGIVRRQRSPPPRERTRAVRSPRRRRPRRTGRPPRSGASRSARRSPRPPRAHGRACRGRAPRPRRA